MSVKGISVVYFGRSYRQRRSSNENSVLMRRLQKGVSIYDESSTVLRKHRVAANGISEVSSAGKCSLEAVA